MSSNRVLVVLVGLFLTLFSGCEQVQDLESGITPSDIQIDAVEYTINNTTLNSKSVVTFHVDVVNHGGSDSIGHIIAAYVDDELIGEKQTGVIESVLSQSVKRVSFTWPASAGEHIASFMVKKDTTSEVDENNTILLKVGVAELQIKTQDEITSSEATASISASLSNSALNKTLSEMISAADQMLEDTLTEVKDESEVAVLKTLKILADDNLTFAEEATSSRVTLGSSESETDPTKATDEVEVTFLPLAKTIESINDVTGSTITKTVVDSGAFVVNISSEIDEISEQIVTDTGLAVVTAKKEVVVPMVIQLDEQSKSTTIENGFGGITITADGKIVVNSESAARYGDYDDGEGEFWIYIAPLFDPYAQEYATGMEEARTFDERYHLIVTVVSRLSGLIAAYDLESFYINEKPKVTCQTSTYRFGFRDGNDSVVEYWSTFQFTATDDKPGVDYDLSEGGSYLASSMPGLTYNEETQTHYMFLEPPMGSSNEKIKVIVVDINGETASVTTRTRYGRYYFRNYYQHDQGIIN